MKYKLLDENNLPKSGEMCYFIRYNSGIPYIGYTKDFKTVYLPNSATKESILNFKSFRPIDANVSSFF